MVPGEYDRYMSLAIDEARLSLRRGNSGFGAVVVKDGRVIAASCDMENTESDPVAHAEINAIRKASKIIGKDFKGCVLVSTHEPCPMCATAVVWSGISEVIYGYSIKDAIAQGRKRIDIPCEEIFMKAGADIKVCKGILKDECAVLYRKDVRAEVEKLRGADDGIFDELNTDSAKRRADWFEKNKGLCGLAGDDILESGYRVLLARLNITEDEAPVIKKSGNEIVFHSRNFCPTLEACKILGLDTRIVCKKLNERSTDALVKLVDGRLRFSRNYEKLRPYADYCEERISLEKTGPTDGPAPDSIY